MTQYTEWELFKAMLQAVDYIHAGFETDWRADPIARRYSMFPGRAVKVFLNRRGL